MNFRLPATRRYIEEHPELVPLLIGVAVLVLRSILNFGESLWLDETIAAWIAKDGFQDVFGRATGFQGQSPFYFLAPWAASKVFGFHEWALRLPSLTFNLVTVAALFHLFRLLAGKDVAGYGAGAFAIIAACDSQLQGARPYALAICCFCVSLTLLVRWAQSAKWSLMICFALATSAILYAHYLFALGLPLFAIVLVYLGKDSRIGYRHILAAIATCAIFTLPAVWQLSRLASDARLYSFSRPPTIDTWAFVMTAEWPTVYLLPIIAAVWLACRWMRADETSRYAGPALLALCVWLYPSVALAAVSLLTDHPVFIQRYALYSVVGESLLLGVLVCLLRPSRLRTGIFVGASALAIASTPLHHFFAEDWRAAINDIPDTTPEPSVVIMWTGLVEGRDLGWVLSPEKRAYLLAPLAMYPVSLPIALMPFNPNEISLESGFTASDRAAITSAKRIFLAIRTNYPIESEITEEGARIRVPWLSLNEAFIKRSLKEYPGVGVLEIERPGPGE